MKSVKICKIHEGFSSTEFLYFKHMFIVPEPKWTQKLVFIVFSACKQNVKASLIWGKELEVFLFKFKLSFIYDFRNYKVTNKRNIAVVPLGIFKDNWHGF